MCSGNFPFGPRIVLWILSLNSSRRYGSLDPVRLPPLVAVTHITGHRAPPRAVVDFPFLRPAFTPVCARLHTSAWHTQINITEHCLLGAWQTSEWVTTKQWDKCPGEVCRKCWACKRHLCRGRSREEREGSGLSQVPKAEEERGGGIRNSGSSWDQVQDGRIQSTGCKEGEQEVGLRDWLGLDHEKFSRSH